MHSRREILHRSIWWNPADRRFLATMIVLAGLFTTPIARCTEPVAPAYRLHLFFSKRVMIELNDNDARAAIKAWAQLVFSENQIPGEAATTIGHLSEVIAGFQDGTIDGASMTTDEFFALSKETPTGMLFFPVHDGDPFEDYLLIVHRSSPVTNLAGLSGSRLAVQNHHRMNLADIWLNTALAREARPAMDRHFANVRRESKTANVVLPVFFRKLESCVVSRRGFNLMTELNPQVGANLRVVASSGKLVPTLFCFNPRANQKDTERAQKGIRDLHRTSFGQQILTTFQLDQLVEGGTEWLKSARELVDEHARLCKTPSIDARASAQMPAGTTGGILP